MSRILLLSTTTGYQTRTFGEAADRLGLEIVFATDRCHQLDDPWRDAAVPIRFYEEGDSLNRLLEAAAERPVEGILALGDRPTTLAARVADALGLPGHPPRAARRASNKLLTRQALTEGGLAAPWYLSAPLDTDPSHLLPRVRYPCVVKPLALSGSRGVIRANTPLEFVHAFVRLRHLLEQVEVRAMRDPANETILIEEYIHGQEFALEAVLELGHLQVLALFDKPDPLVGPFFEETVYVTPSALPDGRQAELVEAVTRAAAALGLRHGPIHAECRTDPRGVYVLEVAARPIGGLCSRALRFTSRCGERITFEELLLRHVCGESVAPYRRESAASALMMVPIPVEGIYRGVRNIDEALQVEGIDEIRITAKPDQRLVPLPEGASYLGFVFARGDRPQAAEAAVREAHRRLQVIVDARVPMVSR